MAAVTVTSKRMEVWGACRVWILKGISVAADGDYFETGFNTVDAAMPVSATNSAVGFTISSSQVVFQTGGAETLTSCVIVGT
jgi:hypothetical protein